MNKEMIKAWALAIFSVTVLWGLGNISVGVASKILGANAVIYTCSIFIGSAFALLLYAGNGDLGKETLRSADTWGYGLILISGFVISFGIFSYTTATEATLLQRSSIIASAFIGWLFLGRHAGKRQLIGLLLVLGGVLMVASGSNPETKGFLFILTILFAFLQAGRSILAEVHKTHSYASENRSEKDRVRVVGYIMFIVAILFLVITFMFSFIEYSTNTNVSDVIPDLKEFTNPNSIFMGLLVGVLIIAPIRLIEFTAAKKINAENYLALGSLAPFTTLFWEWATAPITGLSLKEFTQDDLIAGLVILAGGLVIAFSKAKKQIDNDINEYVYQTVTDVEVVEDSKDIIEKTMTYFNKDVKEVARVLNLPLDVVKAVLEQEDIALKKDVLKRVERVYRIDISSKDSLTGLLNRSGLMQKLELLIKKNKNFTLFYIDLNKFKPINDTYGHQAGDEALQVVAKRLADFHKNVKIVSRLGGDEFVIVLEKNLDIEDFTQALHHKLEEFFTLKTVNMVASISGSIGHVKSVDYKDMNAEELLEFADKMMLDLKEESER
tara:strand:- start:2733 stop:4391 length:1659 start_codon:yes stop_codon:yes gene_type:complete